MAKFLTLDKAEVRNKVVLVRVDFNSALDPETKKKRATSKRIGKTL